jgi:hypothetical protein
MLLAGCVLSFALAFVGTASASDEMVDETASAAPASAAAVSGAEIESSAGLAAAAEPAETTESLAGDDSMPSAAEESAESAPVAEMETAELAPVAEMETAESPPPARPETVLGEIGYDSEGRAGRIHVVVTGDTLWDISDAYLGTPWVWPSVWTDNRDIENPHRINPGDHIWITDSEMRVITQAEADAMRAAGPPGSPAAPDPTDFAADDASMDVTSVPMEQLMRRVATREWVGLVSADDLEAAASIVRRVREQEMLAQMDQVYIGIGDGEVEVGDRFDVIRKQEKVKDPESGRFLGYYVRVMGWIEVDEVHPETALATIRMSTEDLDVGDRLIPRRPESMDIAIQPSPEDIEGMIAFFPRGRVVIGHLDFVYLNRGSLDGLEAGSPLEVVRGGETVNEPVQGRNVEIPRRVVAQLLVVDAQPETAVALVAKSETDLLVGDSFRGIR